MTGKFGIKFFTADVEVDLLDFITVFHRWIQTQALDDLLLDVADYSHVHHGPGILLVAHEGNYAVDEAGGERGLVYYAKRATASGDTADHLRQAARKALCACRLLQSDPDVGSRIRFTGMRVQLFANDRLAAPNDESTRAGLGSAFEKFIESLYPDQPYTLHWQDDPRERFGVTVEVSEAVTVDTLLERLQVVIA